MIRKEKLLFNYVHVMFQIFYNKFIIPDENDINLLYMSNLKQNNLL